jgi:hypothetical protein
MASTVWKGTGDPICGSVQAGNILRNFDAGTWTGLRLACRIAFGNRAAGSSSAYSTSNRFAIGFGAGSSAGGLAGSTLCAGMCLKTTVTTAAGAAYATLTGYHLTRVGSTTADYSLSPNTFYLPTTDIGDDYAAFIIEVLKVANNIQIGQFWPTASASGTLIKTAAELDRLARLETMAASGYTFRGDTLITGAQYTSYGPFNNIHFVSPIGTVQLLIDEVNIYKIL